MFLLRFLPSCCIITIVFLEKCFRKCYVEKIKWWVISDKLKIHYSRIGKVIEHGVVNTVEAWFTFLGFALLTGVFHVAATKIDHLSLVILKWTCYVFLFLWLSIKIRHFFFKIFPSTNPTLDGFSFKKRRLLRVCTEWLSAVIVVGVYFFVLFTTRLFLSVDNQ